jgi:hypothetical protein
MPQWWPVNMPKKPAPMMKRAMSTSAPYILHEGTYTLVEAVPGRLSEDPILVVTTHS